METDQLPKYLNDSLDIHQHFEILTQGPPCGESCLLLDLLRARSRHGSNWRREYTLLAYKNLKKPPHKKYPNSHTRPNPKCKN